MALSVALIVLAAVTTQTLTGFGSALVAMALLPGLVGIQVAAPLVTLMAGTLEVVLLIRYRQALNLRAVWRLSIAAALGIPLGVTALRTVSEAVILTVLGMVLVAYAAYALLAPRLPELKHRAWAYGFGFLAGMLGGAYNTSGPPAVIYGSSQGWTPAEFKSNLQGFFLLNDALVVASRAWDRQFTPEVWANFAASAPAIVLGVAIGAILERFIPPATFRRIVLWLLIVMGLRLIFSR
jgi:hypothetical protein